MNSKKTKNKEQSIGHKQQSIGQLLIQICKHRRNKSNALLAASGIHAGQDILLYHLSLEDGQTVSSLVEKMCIQHATIFTMIERMESVGMISKAKDGLDKRISRVFLTEKGKSALVEIGKVWNTMEELTCTGLSGEQANSLEELLQKVLKNLSAEGSDGIIRRKI